MFNFFEEWHAQHIVFIGWVPYGIDLSLYYYNYSKYGDSPIKDIEGMINLKV